MMDGLIESLASFDATTFLLTLLIAWLWFGLGPLLERMDGRAQDRTDHLSDRLSDIKASIDSLEISLDRIEGRIKAATGQREDWE